MIYWLLLYSKSVSIDTELGIKGLCVGIATAYWVRFKDFRWFNNKNIYPLFDEYDWVNVIFLCWVNHGWTFGWIMFDKIHIGCDIVCHSWLHGNLPPLGFCPKKFWSVIQFFKNTVFCFFMLKGSFSNQKGKHPLNGEDEVVLNLFSIGSANWEMKENTPWLMKQALRLSLPFFIIECLSLSLSASLPLYLSLYLYLSVQLFSPLFFSLQNTYLARSKLILNLSFPKASTQTSAVHSLSCQNPNQTTVLEGENYKWPDKSSHVNLQPFENNNSNLKSQPFYSVVVHSQ